jgi:5'(3')-deoxyribonucleotidase
MKRIFLDMDGVIVDFAKGYEDRVNEREPGYLEKIGYDGDFKKLEDFITADFERIAPNDKEKKKAKYRASNKFWSFVTGDKQWWIDLPWMGDGKELFNSLRTLRQNEVVSEFAILSAPSKVDPCVPGAKQAWLDKQGVSSSFDRIIFENDKYKYAESFNDILIDDTPKKLDAWQNAGGTPLLHTSTANTLKILNELLLQDNT